MSAVSDDLVTSARAPTSMTSPYAGCRMPRCRMPCRTPHPDRARDGGVTVWTRERRGEQEWDAHAGPARSPPPRPTVAAVSPLPARRSARLGWGVIKAEAALARRVIGSPFDDSPDDDGVYGAGRGQPFELVVLGDSSAAGMGADAPHETVGAIIASGVSALTGRRVRLTNPAVVGAESSDLERQLANALEDVLRPRRRAHHGRRQRRDPPHRAVGVGARARADGAADPGPGLRGRRGHVPRPRDHPADPAAAAVADEAVVARPRGRPDRRGRRGRRSNRVARRPPRARVRRVAPRDVQQGPLPPVGRRLRPGRRGAAAERVRGAGGLGRRHHRPAARAAPRRGRGAGGRGGRPGRQGAGHRGRADRDRGPGARAAGPVGRAAAAPARRRAAGRGHPRGADGCRGRAGGRRAA